MTAIRMEKI